MSASRHSIGQVARPAVRDRNRGGRGEQQRGDRLADDVRAADHHRARTLYRVRPQARSGPCSPSGVHGTKARQPRRQPPGVDHMKPVHILRRDRPNRSRRPRQCAAGSGKLDEYAVDRIVGVQPRCTSASKSTCARRRRQARDAKSDDPRLARLPPFVTHIDFARRVLPHQHGGKPRRLRPWAARKAAVSIGHARAQPGRERLAVEDRRRHHAPPTPTGGRRGTPARRPAARR